MDSKTYQDKVANEWPQSVVDFAGFWENFPSLGEIRATIGKDTKRELI